MMEDMPHRPYRPKRTAAAAAASSTARACGRHRTDDMGRDRDKTCPYIKFSDEDGVDTSGLCRLCLLLCDRLARPALFDIIAGFICLFIWFLTLNMLSLKSKRYSVINLYVIVTRSYC